MILGKNDTGKNGITNIWHRQSWHK